MTITKPSCTEFLIISLSVTSTIALATYVVGANAIGKQAYTDQSEILTKRADYFTKAKNDLLESITNHLEKPNFKQQSIQILSSTKRFRPGQVAAKEELNEKLMTEGVLQTDIEAESISIMTAGAIFSLSTDRSKIGRYQPVQNTSTYVDPDKNESVSLRFFENPTTKKPTTTLAFPIKDNNNKRRGYYAVDINPKSLYDSMFEADKLVELSPPERTHAVAYTSLSSITEIYNPVEPEKYPALKSAGITNGLTNQKGSYLYLNHSKKPVVGAYQYVPAANMALLIERDQYELFRSPRQRLIKIMVIGSLISMTGFVGLKWLKAKNSD